MPRSVSGYNEEARKGREEAVKYVKAWQFELSKLSAMLISDFTSKKISQAVYNLKRDEINKNTEDLNNCVKALNNQATKM